MGTLLQFPPAIEVETLAISDSTATLRVWFNHERPRVYIDMVAPISEEGALAELMTCIEIMTGPHIGPRLTPAVFRQLVTTAGAQWQ